MAGGLFARCIVGVVPGGRGLGFGVSFSARGSYLGLGWIHWSRVICGSSPRDSTKFDDMWTECQIILIHFLPLISHKFLAIA